jgi:hypothetical protein
MIKNRNYYIRKREALLKQLRKAKPFIGGSIAAIERSCGNPNCKCRKKGKKHIGYYLFWKEKKETKGLYIPVDLKEEVELWNEEYKNLRDIIKEISELSKIIIKGYVKEKRGRKRHAKNIR